MNQFTAKQRFYFLVVFVALLLTAASSQEKFDPYLQIELKRLQEVYGLLDRFAEEVWPGWNNYAEVELRVQFPNLTHLLYSPGTDGSGEYEPLSGVTLGGRPVYFNNRSALPFTPRPPLIGGGGIGRGGALRIRMTLQELDTAYVNNHPMAKQASDDQILVYVHELFHGYQKKFEKDRKDVDQRVLFAFLPTVEYATYSEIEAEALLRALQEPDDVRALEYLKDYFVALKEKYRGLTPTLRATESSQCMLEGTAMYAQVKTMMLIGDKHYQPRMTSQDDPYFSGFRSVAEGARHLTISQLERQKGSTLSILARHYTIGLFQCLLLDRFMPKWKEGCLENNKTQFDLLSELLRLTPEEEQSIAARISSRYSWETVAARHRPVIQERDDAIALVKSRKGKRYIVDFEKTKEFFRAKARGKQHSIGSTTEQIFPQGVEQLTLGEIELSTVPTPVHRTGLWTIEWIDTDRAGNDKGYDLKYEEKTGEVLKHVVLTTKGFSLKAPEVILQDTTDQLRIVLLSKMAK